MATHTATEQNCPSKRRFHQKVSNRNKQEPSYLKQGTCNHYSRPLYWLFSLIVLLLLILLDSQIFCLDPNDACPVCEDPVSDSENPLGDLPGAPGISKDSLGDSNDACLDCSNALVDSQIVGGESKEPASQPVS